MNALHRLQFQLMQDEVCDRWHSFLNQIRNLCPQRQHRIGISLAEANQESEGRVWVEVGNEGLRLRVSHLHPANPSVAETLKRKCKYRRESHPDSEKNSLKTWLTGKLIYPPEDDKISLSSLEDYWFNHWQGPLITADNNQNSYSLSKLRISHGKSRRTNRCSICHKKRVVTEEDDNKEGNILTHRSRHSVKLDAKTIKDEFEDKSDDEASEEALSRCSASDEHLSRAHRILDNELRTSFSLFADEAVSQDVIDATVSMKAWDEVSSPDGSNRFFNSPPSPRQSRSCPCSPKLSARTYSPESISNSPKSRSFIGSSKFSLSSSLLAIHRQASNTFIPEFLKFDKSDSPGASKANSQQNSLRLQNRRHRNSLSESTDLGKEEGLPSRLECQTYPIFPSIDDSFVQPISSNKRPIAETQSLPTLRLCKMTLTYRGGVIISEEKEGFETEDLGECRDHGAVALPISNNSEIPLFEEKNSVTEGNLISKKLLPDVVPDQQIGAVNLGFDGTEESSDFNDIIVPTQSFLENQHRPTNYENNVTLPQTEKCPANENENKFPESLSQASNLQMDDSCSSTSMTTIARTVSSGAATNEQFGFLPNIESGTLDGGQYNTFVEKDIMQEARDMVFWWRKKSLPTEEELEYCLHETECKVKQKPLLLFLHGIGSSADVWNQQLWYFLSCGYEVVAPDLLGHGMSSAPKDKKYYNFASMLDYISLVFDLFIPQGRKCIVIGHNYGCALAVALARGRPLSVGLVILASCGGPSPLAPYTKYESSLNSWVTRLLKPYISCGCLSRELLYTPRGKHFIPVASDEKGFPATPPYVIDNISSGQHWPEGDLAFHRRITIPTLLLHGMKDSSVSFVEMCEMEKTIPRAFLELIPGAGHELMTDSAEEVCHAIHRFIRRWKNHI